MQNMCQNYLNETNKFTVPNGQACEIRREIDCHSVHVIDYLKYKISNEKDTYIAKIVVDNTGVSTCKLPRHVYDCGIKNNCLNEPLVSLNIMLRLKKVTDLKPGTTPVEINNQFN